MIGYISYFWDWLWYYRQAKIRYRVYDYGDTYMAMASDGTCTVYNCYGSTPEDAKEIALLKLRKFKEWE